MKTLYECARNEEERKALEVVLNLPPCEVMRLAEQSILALMRVERETHTDGMRYLASGVLDRFEVRRER